MANVFSIISIVTFVLSGLFLLAAIVLFFAMDARSAYLELKGQPHKRKLEKGSGNKRANSKTQKMVHEVKAERMDVEDEAVTTLDNGEIATEVSLMNVYEPGTELFTEHTTESLTEVKTNQLLRDEFWEEESETSLESSVSVSEFKIIKRIVFAESDEILK